MRQDNVVVAKACHTPLAASDEAARSSHIDPDYRDCAPIKLAVASHTLPPQQNGQAIVLSHLLRGLGYDDCALIAQPLPGVADTEIDEDRLRVGYFILPPNPRLLHRRLLGLCYLLRPFEKIISFFVRAKRICRIIREQNCDVLVTCTGEWFELPTAWLAARWANVPLATYVFDWYSRKFCYLPGLSGVIANLLARSLEGPILRRSAVVMVPNEFLQREYARRLGVTTTIVRNPTGFSPPETATGCDHWPARQGAICIRYTGAVYEAHYDAMQNLAAAASLVQGASVHLELYSDADPNVIEENGIKGPLTIMPRVPLDQVRDVQREADILFLPLAFSTVFPEIIRTSAPGKLADYLASGKPILVNAPPDSFLAWFFKEHQCGVVVDVSDPKPLADAIQRIIDDAELRATIVRNASNLAQMEFSVQSSRRRFFDAIEQLQPGRQAQPAMGTGELPIQWPSISVIIPTHNRATFIDTAISSVLEQDYPNLECIVVDDGSTDNTEEVVQKWLPQIQYTRQHNQGASAARNRGLELATGDFIAFLDSDDYFLPQKLREQAAYLQRHADASLVASWCLFTWENGQQCVYRTKIRKGGYKEFLWQAMNNNVCTPTAMVRRTVIDAVGDFDESMPVAEDQDFFVRVARHGRIHVLPSVLTVVRRHRENISNSLDPDVTLQAWLKMFDKVFASEPSLEPSLLRRFRVEAHLTACSIATTSIGRVRWDLFIAAVRLDPFSYQPYLFLFRRYMSKLRKVVKRLDAFIAALTRLPRKLARAAVVCLLRAMKTLIPSVIRRSAKQSMRWIYGRTKPYARQILPYWARARILATSARLWQSYERLA